MPRRFDGLTRALGGLPLASVAYGEIGSSVYFALGVVALHALGLTPWLLLGVGALFLLVSLSYAEGTAALPEPGGAALFVRRAFNDPAGFVTGWALYLDYVIVIALAALFVPHYLAAAVGWRTLSEAPWDVVVGVGVVGAVALVRLIRRPRLYALAVAIAVVAFVSHLILIALGLPLLFDSAAIGFRADAASVPSWSELAFALPVAMLAFTGLETIANYAAEAREPGRTLPRSLFAGIGAVVAVSAAMAVVGLSAFPPLGGSTAIGEEWRRAPLAGIADAVGAQLPAAVGEALEFAIAAAGVLVLVAAVTTSMSGAGRLTYSLARHGMLPRAFERLNRRTLLAPAAIVTTAALAAAFLVASDAARRPSVFLAGLYSFGVLLAFTAAQVAVVRLRKREPDLPRPFKAPGMPLLGLVGAAATGAIWVVALATHDAARIAGPLWVGGGLLVYAATRRARGARLAERVRPGVADLVPTREGEYRRILVPLKLGEIGDEVLATAIRLAAEHEAAITALHVIAVPLHEPLDAELHDEEERAAASLAEAKLLASEHGVAVDTAVVRARSIGAVVVEQAREREADLVMMGSAPRWRRQSRFFSPTVEYVLRRAPCEVMVVAFPQGVLEEAGVPA